MKIMREALLLLALAGAAPSLRSGQAKAQDTTKPGGSGEAWQIIQPPQSSLVFARDGSFLGEIGRQSRTSVPKSSLPSYVWQAFVATEDKRFFEHDGVDMKGIAAAVKDNILGERRGASTIPMLLADAMHPDLIDRSERSGFSG